jgi:hypothetical protein
MTNMTTTNPVGGDGLSPALGAVDPNAIQYSVGAADDGDDEDMETVIHDGRAYGVPKSLTPALMMRAAYTRKTQDLADQQRAWEQDRAQQAELDESQLHLRAMVLALDSQMAHYDRIDWQAMEASNPAGAASLWRRFQQLKDSRAEIIGHVAALDQHQAVQAQHDHAAKLQHGHAVLAREVPGWSPDMAGKLAVIGQTAFGFSPEELSKVTDPRLVKLLHRAALHLASAGGQAQAQRIAQGQKTQPAPAVRGGGRFAVGADTNDFAAFEKLADSKLKHRS